MYYSDSPEEEEDEELRAMQNIRNRGRRQHDVVGHTLLACVIRALQTLLILPSSQLDPCVQDLEHILDTPSCESA